MLELVFYISLLFLIIVIILNHSFHDGTIFLFGISFFKMFMHIIVCIIIHKLKSFKRAFINKMLQTGDFPYFGRPFLYK